MTWIEVMGVPTSKINIICIHKADVSIFEKYS